MSGIDDTTSDANQDGIVSDPDDAPLGDTTVGDTAADAEFDGLATAEPIDDESYPASQVQPESQGEDPVVAELGEDGEGDLSPEDI